MYPVTSVKIDSERPRANTTCLAVDQFVAILFAISNLKCPFLPERGNSTIPRSTKLSAVDVTAKSFCQFLVFKLVPGPRRFSLFPPCPWCAHTPTACSATFCQSFLKKNSRMAPEFSCQHHPTSNLAESRYRVPSWCPQASQSRKPCLNSDVRMFSVFRVSLKKQKPGWSSRMVLPPLCRCSAVAPWPCHRVPRVVRV